MKKIRLNPDEKIVVFWTKEISLPHFNRYRVRFRRVWSGRVIKMEGFRWKRKKKMEEKAGTID